MQIISLLGKSDNYAFNVYYYCCDKKKKNRDVCMTAETNETNDIKPQLLW